MKEFSNMCKTSNHAKTDIKRAVIVIFLDDPTGTADFVTTVCKSDSEIKLIHYNCRNFFIAARSLSCETSRKPEFKRISWICQ